MDTEIVHACWVPGAPSIIDVMANERTAMRGETIDEVRQRHPGAIVGPLGDFVLQKEASYLAEPPVEVDLERWIDALEVLPPARWVRMGSEESFQMSEHLCGRVTTCYVRIGRRYCEMRCIARTRHTELVERARAFFNANPR